MRQDYTVIVKKDTENKQETTNITLIDINDVIIHNNYQFSLFASEYPLFSLKLDKKTLEYQFTSRSGIKITIRNTNLGRATIQDADIFLYCTTKICQLVYEKKTVTRRITFTCYDFLKKTGRNTAGSDYQQIIHSLKRLASTKIETNKTIANIKVGSGLGLIESFCCHRNEKNGKLEKIEILLPEWLFAEIMLMRIVTINPEYLKLKPLERRIYQLAKTHCRPGLTSTEFKLDYFIKKIGSLNNLRYFRFQINKLCKNQPLPNFLIHYEQKEDKIWFTSRDYSNVDEIKIKDKKTENKELKQNISQQNSLKNIAQKFIINRDITLLQSKVEIKKQVAYTLRELDRLYPLKKEAIFRSDVLTKSKIYSYIKEFGPQALLKAIKQHADFDFSAVDNPGGYFWKILKNSRK